MAGAGPRERIIDHRALRDDLDDLARRFTDEPAELRAALLARCKSGLAEGRVEISWRCERGASGSAVAAANSYLIDQLVQALFSTARHQFRLSAKNAEDLTIVAVGGYGRGELAPHSDIDLLFLVSEAVSSWSEQVIELMLYVLWDLGLTVGHAVRSITDCLRLAAADETVATALIDARLVAGDRSQFGDLRRRFAEWLSNDDAFVRTILSERDERHRRMGDSRYVVEPNVKHGKGGLRDLHNLYWIARARCRVRTMHALVSHGWLTEAEYRRCLAAQRFLWTVRCHLHFLADRAEERLTLDAQGEIAQRMGFIADSGARAVERFMKRYYLVTRDVGDLSRILIAEFAGEPRRQAERRTVGGFAVENEQLTLQGDAEFVREPVRMLRLFHVAETQGIGISPHALRLVIRNQQRIDGAVRADPKANSLFVELLTSRHDPEGTLRLMNEARILGRFIPEFGRVVAQTQHDTYHVYTVDEHTIRAVGVLSKIERGAMRDTLPLATSVFPEILSRRALYLAVFLHDIAKGRGGDHSVLGAELARTLAPRLGFTDEETETVSWLVRHHLLFSLTAFKRDVHDPKTVSDFVAVVRSLERLRLLLVLTKADICAVGPKVWNGWKGALLHELYVHAAERISGGHRAPGMLR